MTHEQKVLSRRYIAYQAFRSMYFIGVSWFFFYRLFMSDQQIGLLDGIAFVIGILAEIPSGALADLVGRARIVRLGMLLMAAGFLVQGLSSSFTPILIGQIIFLFGIAFTSGADDALFFDKLKFDRDSHEWRRLVMRGTQVSRATALIALVVGGALYSVDYRLAWHLNVVAFCLAAVALWGIRDQRVKRAKVSLGKAVTNYFGVITQGYREFTKPELLPYLPLIFSLQGLFYTFGFGLLRPALIDRFTFDAFWGSVIVASSNIVTVVALHYLMRNNQHIAEKKFLTALAGLAVAALVATIFPVGKVGLLIVIYLHVAEHILYPFMSEILNKHTAEAQRATVLSFASLLKSLPYAVLAPLIGWLNGIGHLEYYLVVWAVFVVLSAWFYTAKVARSVLFAPHEIVEEERL